MHPNPQTTILTKLCTWNSHKHTAPVMKNTLCQRICWDIPHSDGRFNCRHWRFRHIANIRCWPRHRKSTTHTSSPVQFYHHKLNNLIRPRTPANTHPVHHATLLLPILHNQNPHMHPDTLLYFPTPWFSNPYLPHLPHNNTTIITCPAQIIHYQLTNPVPHYTSSHASDHNLLTFLFTLPHTSQNTSLSLQPLFTWFPNYHHLGNHQRFPLTWIVRDRQPVPRSPTVTWRIPRHMRQQTIKPIATQAVGKARHIAAAVFFLLLLLIFADCKTCSHWFLRTVGQRGVCLWISCKVDQEMVGWWFKYRTHRLREYGLFSVKLMSSNVMLVYKWAEKDGLHHHSWLRVYLYR